jgi:hypothetical protein
MKFIAAFALVVLCSCGVGATEQAAQGTEALTADPQINPYGPEYHSVCPKDAYVSSSCVAATAQADCNAHCAKAVGKGPPICAKLAPTLSAQCAP